MTNLKTPADQIERIKRERRRAELLLHTGVFIFLIGGVLISVALVGMFYPIEPAYNIIVRHTRHGVVVPSRKHDIQVLLNSDKE